MAELEKLNDNELDAVSGGTKYNVGNRIFVYSVPGGSGNVISLNVGDFLVTDGDVVWVNGAPWSRVHTAYGNGYISGLI